MQLDEIRLETNGAVAEITLDRPEQRNPISAGPGRTHDQILWALDAAAGDPAIGCVLLRGAGPAFSAGGNLTGNERRETESEHAAFLEQVDAFHDRVRATALPVVAAVHGYCLGAALNLAACCDLVVAAETARFGLPEGRLGLVGVSPLVTVVGRQWAKFLILTGELIDAPRAREIGLVLTVEPDDRLLERARDLCRRLSRMPRTATRLNKEAVNGVADAAGDRAARLAGLSLDATTLASSALATAPDGRPFREILDTEGIEGMKRARADQYDEPWLG